MWTWKQKLQNLFTSLPLDWFRPAQRPDQQQYLLAEKLPGLSLTSLTGAELELSERLKRPVGIVLKSELHGREEQEVLATAQPL